MQVFEWLSCWDEVVALGGRVGVMNPGVDVMTRVCGILLLLFCNADLMKKRRNCGNWELKSFVVMG